MLIICGQKVGHHLYPDHIQFPNDRGRKHCGSVQCLERLSFLTGFGGWSLPCPGPCQLRNTLFHPHTCYPVAASPANVYHSASLIRSQHYFHVSFWQGLSLGSVLCDWWFRLPHHAKITEISLQKQGQLGHWVNSFKQHTGFHILFKQRGPLGAGATHVTWFIYVQLFVLKNKTSSLRDSYVNNGSEPCW